MRVHEVFHPTWAKLGGFILIMLFSALLFDLTFLDAENAGDVDALAAQAVLLDLVFHPFDALAFFFFGENFLFNQTATTIILSLPLDFLNLLWQYALGCTLFLIGKKILGK